MASFLVRLSSWVYFAFSLLMDMESGRCSGSEILFWSFRPCIRHEVLVRLVLHLYTMDCFGCPSFSTRASRDACAAPWWGRGQLCIPYHTTNFISKDEILMRAWSSFFFNLHGLKSWRWYDLADMSFRPYSCYTIACQHSDWSWLSNLWQRKRSVTSAPCCTIGVLLWEVDRLLDRLNRL